VSPGAVATDIFSTFNTSKMPAEALNAMMTTIPFLASKDIADSIVYLLSTPPTVLITELTIRPMNEQF
jgi:NADP-dependent 3-hydroxy acid dehydrogenase YdfG